MKNFHDFPSFQRVIFWISISCLVIYPFSAMTSIPKYFQYAFSSTNLSSFTILTWWYDTARTPQGTPQGRAIISLIKDGSFSTGLHLHAGCKDAKEEMCLTYTNQDDHFASRKLATNSSFLKDASSLSKWTYIGVSYSAPTQGNTLVSYAS